LSFNQQRDGGGAKATPKHDLTTSKARFSSLIDDSVTDLETDADSLSNATTSATAAIQPRPPSAGGMQSSDPSSADSQLRSLLRDEFIIRQAVLPFRS